MENKDLQKMSRKDLLELLIEQMEENEVLQAKLKQAEMVLEDRRIKITKAGSIAKAALDLSGIFEAADAAARMYVENVCRMMDERIEGNEKREAQIADDAQHRSAEK